MRKNSEKGSGILEVALVLPVLMITLLAIADLGRYVYATNLMPYLAREGARWASLEAGRPVKSLDPQAVSKYVRGLAAGLPEDAVKVETSLAPQLVAVKVTWVFQPVLNVFGGPVTVRGHASMRRYVP
jgi:Flp pilus assembly protein TadG